VPGTWLWSRAHGWRAEAGYGVVLVVIAVTYAVSAVADNDPRAAAAVLALQLVALHIIFTVVGARRVFLVVIDAGLAVMVVMFVVITLSHRAGVDDGDIALGLFWLSALLYGVAPVVIVLRTLSRRTVDAQTLLAAISAYLILGMFFAFLYRATAASQAGPFFGPAGDGTFSDDLFFSFVTLSTTGYGDLVPAGNPGQTMAVAEAILGQLFLVIAVAKIVNESGLLRPRTRDPEG
jgi:hypothetical protein